MEEMPHSQRGLQTPGPGQGLALVWVQWGNPQSHLSADVNLEPVTAPRLPPLPVSSPGSEPGQASE